MSNDLQYILIDDSEFDLFLNKEFLLMSGITGPIESFDSAADALAFIIKEGDQIKESIILLDIHMPIMNGFEFLEKFELFPEHIKNKVKVFMVSSTLDLKDRELAKNSKTVIDLLPKPLNVKVLKEKLGT